MKVGTSKIKKELSRKEINRRNNIKRITIATIIGMMMFVALVFLQKSLLDEGDKVSVCVIKDDVGSGTHVTESNLSSVIQTSYLYKSMLPKDYIREPKEVLGKYITRDMYKNQIITIHDVSDDESEYYNGASNPVKITFSMDNISMAVGGEIRRGDSINIHAVLKQNNDTTNITMPTSRELKNIKVYEALDSSGNPVSEGSVAVMYAIFIDESNVDAFIEMITYYDLTVTKNSRGN